ncbi:MAG: F0F1 ATP synthase subunit B, partial [SAR202 cluster bacterium]|nr:F0F1 ATP synthase subunit B [SAR202 cluster bacterium]
QIVSFVILFVLLWSLLYKPVVRMLDQRSERIRESLEASQRAQQEAASSAEEVEKQLEAARAEGQQLIAQARDVADRFREDEVGKVRNEIAAERERAQTSIERERDAAIEDLRREFAGLAIVAAERVIERSLDASAHRELIDQVLEEGSDIGSRN